MLKRSILSGLALSVLTGTVSVKSCGDSICSDLHNPQARRALGLCPYRKANGVEVTAVALTTGICAAGTYGAGHCLANAMKSCQQGPTAGNCIKLVASTMATAGLLAATTFLGAGTALVATDYLHSDDAELALYKNYPV